MATFADQYKKLFGRDLEFDTIDPGPDPYQPPTPRLDLTDEGLGTSTDPQPAKFYDLYRSLGGDIPEPEESAGAIEQVGRGLASGAVQTGGLALGGLEYAARQAEDMAGGIPKEILSDIRGGLTTARQATNQYAQDLLSGIGEEALGRMERQILSLDPNQSVWRGSPGEVVQSLGLKFTQALPATIMTLLPAARLFKAGMTPGAITYLGASEGGLSLGGIANGIAEEVEGMSDAELRQESRYYAALMDQGLSEDEARRQLISHAQGVAPLVGGALVGVISAGAGRFLEPVFTGSGAPLARRFGTGFAIEGAQEAPQSGFEQVAQNIASAVYDADRGVTEGVAEAMAEGLVIGGLTGGAFTSVFGVGPRRQVPPEPQTGAPPAPTPRTPGTGPSPTEQPPLFDDIQPQQRATFDRAFETVEQDVDRASRAALEERMGDLFVEEDQTPSPAIDQMGLPGMLAPEDPLGLRPSERRMPAPAAPQGQQPLPLTRRERGGYSAAPVPEGGRQPGPPVRSYAPDLTTPQGQATTDPRQLDIEGREGPVGVPFTPSAEPLSDIDAQVREMQRPEGDREAVYLSADNLATLQRTGELERILDTGVPIPNFDEAGGTLIAKDRQTAELLQGLKDEGGDLEQIIGSATLAGTGKPAGGQLVVQRRDESGAVVQEQLVADELEADRVIEDWEQRYPNFDIDMRTAEAAIRRRETLLAKESKKPLARERSRRGRTKADRPTRQAARLIGEAVRETAKPERRRIGGFYPTEALEFADEREAVRYRNRFQQLTDQELKLELAARDVKKADETRPPRRVRNESIKDFNARRSEFSQRIRKQRREAESRRIEAAKTRGALLDELGDIRKRAKPTLKSEPKLRRAADISPATVREVEGSSRRTATRPAEGLPTPDTLEYDTESLRQLTDAQIDKLSGDTLEGVFRNALNYRLASQRRGITTTFEGRGREVPEFDVASEEDIESGEFVLPEGTPEGVDLQGYERAPTDALPSDAQMIAIRKSGMTLDETLAAHAAPSMKRRLIRRIRNKLVREEFSPSRGAEITETATESKMESGKFRRKGKFNTDVLTVENLPKDESKANRIKREQKAKSLRNKLDKTLRRASRQMERFSTGKFAKQAKEVDSDGKLTSVASELVHAKAYFRFIVDFAAALQRSNNKSPGVLREIEKVNKFLTDTMQMDVPDFTRVLSKALKAEAQVQIRRQKFSDDLRERLSDPSVRDKMNAESLKRLMAAQARVARMENLWKENAYYNNIVGPIIHKFTESNFRDGYPSYKPSEKEMEQLKWVLDNWKIDRLREDFYTPIRRFLSNIGFEWDKKDSLIIPRDEEGRYDYHVPDKALLTQYANRFGTEAENALPRVEHQEVTTELEHKERDPNQPTAPRSVKEKKKYIRVRARPYGTEVPNITEQQQERAADIETFGRMAQANRIIEKFRNLIAKPKTTVAGMVRSEQRLIRAFKELGLWEDVSERFGRIKFRQPKRYQKVGPRLESKELRKEEARDIMLKQLKPAPLPRDLARDPTIRARAQQPVRAETEAFLEVTNLGRNRYDFEDVAGALYNRLEKEKTFQLNEVLPMIAEVAPGQHSYSALATQLMKLNLDTQVAWGENFKKSNQAGYTRWDNIEMPDGSVRQWRWIGLNRDMFSTHPDFANAFLHTILHEAVHVATNGAIDRNTALRQAVGTLQKIGRTELRRQGKEIPYGLEEHHPEGEFVSEAFSNPTFQETLRSIPFDNTQSVWAKFINYVRQVLGLGEVRTPSNMLEAIIDLRHPLFTGETRVVGGQTSAVAYLEDPAMRSFAGGMGEVFDTNMQRLRDGWQKARRGGIRAPLALMTMRQIHKEFSNYFNEPGGGKNSLDRYKQAWEQRDAENSRLLKQGENVSQLWTSATEKHGTKDALEFSRLATESSMYGIHPNLPLTDQQNSHLDSPEQKAKHAELAKRYRAMPDDWKNVWDKTRKYYNNALQDETNLIMLNALRGVVATGNNPVMGRAEFDRKYDDKKVQELDLTSEEGLRKEFPDLSPEQVGTLQEIASIPTLRQGPYYPLMRYGDFVVYAQREAESKTFSDQKAAGQWAQSKRKGDPTLDVTTRPVGGGKYTVSVVEKDFRTFENRTEAENAQEEMIEQYGATAVSDVQLKDKFKTEDTIQSGSALASILGELEGNPKAQNAIRDWWLRTLSDSAFRKHEIGRKNRRGVDYDSQHRNFTNYVKKSSYYRSQLRFGWRMADAMRDLRAFVKDYKQGNSSVSNERLGQIRDHLRDRDRMTDDIYEMGNIIRKGSEIGQMFYLFGPSYWAINSSQPWMVSYPWLAARYGYGAAGASMANAQANIISPLLKATKDSLGGIKAAWSKEATEKAFNVLDQIKQQIERTAPDRADQYNDMLENLREHNIIELSWVSELRDISEGTQTGGWQRLVDGTRVMGHLVEVNNRVLTALATYDLRYNEVIARQGATHEMAHSAAIELAKDAVAETHFDYSAGNKPLLFQPRGPVGRFAPWVFQFMQWPQHMYAMMVSNMASLVGNGTIDRKTAAKTLAGIFGTHAIAGGLIGATLQPLKWAIGAAIWAMSDDEDAVTGRSVISGEAFEHWVREAAVDIAGPDIGHALASGVPATALGADISRRVDLGTVYYLDLRTDSAEATLGSLASTFMGAVPNLAFNAFSRAIPAIAEGDWQRGMEYAAPKALRDISRAWRYGTDGMTNNAGDQVIPSEGLSPYQLFLQASGFQPSEISDFYSRQSLIKDTERYGEERRNSLLKRFRTAESIEERGRVLEEVREFNRAFPYVAITRSSLLRAIAGKAEREASFRTRGAALRGRAVALAQRGSIYDKD